MKSGVEYDARLLTRREKGSRALLFKGGLVEATEGDRLIALEFID
jgi:hypothetical protein